MTEVRPSEPEQDIYRLFLETYLLHLPEEYAKAPGSVIRIMAEAQAKAIAAVFANFR
jgi:hypothetical protein